MSSDLYLGIDFSGNHRMWRPLARSSNVWIAEVTEHGRRLDLRKLCAVQSLGGTGEPFDRLATRLRTSSFRAAGLDAPFSIPARFLGGRSYARLLAKVGELSRLTPERPFAQARRFVKAVAGVDRCDPPKPLRRTEAYWPSRRV